MGTWDAPAKCSRPREANTSVRVLESLDPGRGGSITRSSEVGVKELMTRTAQTYLEWATLSLAECDGATRPEPLGVRALSKWSHFRE